MKVLILTVTAGYGHHSTAKAIEDTLKEKGATVKTIDVYKYINKVLYSTVDKGYLLSTKYTPEVYRAVYNFMDNKEQPNSRFNIPTIMNMLVSLKFSQPVEAFGPDAIICTHIFSAQVMNELKRRGFFKEVPCFGIVTDYTIHPYWEDVPEIEYIVTASELLNHRAIKKGIEKERIKPFGIPIQPKFNNKIEKEKAREILGIEQEVHTILLVGGSMGYGNMRSMLKQIDELDMPLQILVVCGNNKRQYRNMTDYRKMQKLKQVIHVYGFVDNMEVMMDAADCIITKPGGLTVSEALAKNLPMILFDPIPGQEERNLEFLLNNGIAIKVTKTSPLDEAIFYLFSNPERLHSVHENMKIIGKPSATEDLVNFIMSLNKQDDE